MRKNGEKLAFVLSGGGALGSLQVGCLEILVEHDILPDIIVGTSVGAINGAWLAKYPSVEGINKLKEIWISQLGDQLIPESKLHQLFRVFLGKNYISTNQSLRTLLCRYFDRSTTFADLKIPLSVTSANLATGQLTVFSEGPVMPAILASTAIPGLFEPVVIEGELFVDGAIISNCSIETAWKQGATTIIAIECPHPRPRNGKGLINVLKQVAWVSISQLCHLERTKYKDKCKLIVLEPEIANIDNYDITDFSRTEYLINAAKLWTNSFVKENYLQLMVGMANIDIFPVNNAISKSEGEQTLSITADFSKNCEWKHICGSCEAN